MQGFLTIAAITEAQGAITAAVIAAAATIFIAVVTGVVAYFSAKRERRRETYSKATRAAVAWKEMVYRVRRRRKSGEESLIESFHLLQDDLAYYEAWIGSESKFMARAYKRLVANIKSETLDLIRTAWQDPIRPIPGDAQKRDKHPDIDAYVDDFLLDVRRHLSPWLLRKPLMWLNNRKNKSV